LAAIRPDFGWISRVICNRADSGPWWQMEETTETATTEASRDLSPAWHELIARVRGHARRTIDDPAADARELAHGALTLCAHLERLHAGVEHLLAGGIPPAPAAQRPDVQPAEGLTDEEKQALKIQRELHEPSSVRDVIKALFLWQDYPEERLEQDKPD
jgi:hypothetical protein